MPWMMRSEGEESSVGVRRDWRREGERARTVMVREAWFGWFGWLEELEEARHLRRVARAIPPVAEMKRTDLLGWGVVEEVDIVVES